MPTQWICENCYCLLREELALVNEVFWLSQPLVMKRTMPTFYSATQENIISSSSIYVRPLLISRFKGITVSSTGNIFCESGGKRGQHQSLVLTPCQLLAPAGERVKFCILRCVAGNQHFTPNSEERHGWKPALITCVFTQVWTAQLASDVYTCLNTVCHL